MEQIWIIVNNKEPDVIRYFERLYIQSVIDNNRFQDSEEYLLFQDIKRINNYLENGFTLKEFNPKSKTLSDEKELELLREQEELTPEEITFIRNHYLADFNYLSTAITLFDSYIKGIYREKRNRISDNIIKVVIAIISVISTLVAVWLGASL